MALAIDPDLGTALRSLRQRRGLGLDELSRLSGASKAALSSWENGVRRPRGPALSRLLDALGAEPRLKARLLNLADPQQARIALAKSILGPPVDVGLVLRVMRERRGISQSDLARKIGVSQAAVSQWESGDATPSAEMIHAIGFALGAAAEETVALASVQASENPGLSQDPDVALQQVWDQPWSFELREATLLGREAELWRRAGWDSRWDRVLAASLSLRANLLTRQERYEEISAVALRCLRLATTPEARQQSAGSVAALADADRHLGRGHARAVQLAGQAVAELKDSHARAWMLRQQGMSLVRMGRIGEGIDLVARSSAMDIEVLGGHPDPWCHQASIVCEALLEAGEPRRADAVLNGRRERLFHPSTYVSILHANGRAASDAEMTYLRFWLSNDTPSRYEGRRLIAIERRQAWLKGERSSPSTHEFDTAAPAGKDAEVEERLWAAVIREHKG